MKTIPSSRSCLAWSLVVALAMTALCRAQTNAPVAGGSESVGIIDFEGAPVTAVLDYYARLTKRSIIAAPNLAGVIRFRSQTELTKAEALQALDTVLAMNGVTVIPMGEKFLKVVQAPTAKQEGVRIGLGEAAGLPASDAFLAQVVKIKYAELTDVTSAVQPLLHSYGSIVPLHQSNSILVIDTANNVNQMLELLKHVDQPYELRLESKVYQLRYAKAAEAVQRIQTILQSAQQFQPKAGGGGAPSAPGPAPAPGAPARPASTGAIETKTILSPDERTNKIFVLSRSKNFDLLDKIIAEMDVKVEPDVITKVVELNYANADEAASLVNAVIGGGSGYTSASASSRRSTHSTSRGATGITGATRTTTPAPSTPVPTVRTGGAGVSEPAAFLEYPEGVRILPDMRTNTLLLMATKDDMDRIVQLVKSIDTTVPQVLIEVIIGEVTLANQNDTGVDLIQRVIKAGPANLFGGTLTGDASGPRPINIGAAAIGSTPAGAAISSALTYWATFRKLNLDAVIRLLATEGKLRVLSTPVIQTLHNQEGSIIVGSSVPVATSTLSDVITSGSSSTNQFASGLRANVEYKDVALELFVTPRVNPDGYVTLEINQKVNELGEDKNIGGIVVPSIQKREAQSVVMVQDQSTVVLGGLIKDRKSRSETKVPVLGDVPLLGWLFKSRKDTIDRDELIVFIRPVVLRTETAAAAEGRRRLHMLDSIKELGIEKKLDPTPATNTPPPVVTPPPPPEPRRGATPSNLKLGPRKSEQ